MDRGVSGHERQAIGQFKALLGQAAALAIGAQTHSGLIDQVQSQASFDPLGGCARPRAHEVPGSQAQVLWQQEPDADLIAGNFIGQELADPSLQALGISGCQALLLASALGLNELRRVGGIKGVEFFFAGRNRR